VSLVCSRCGKNPRAPRRKTCVYCLSRAAAKYYQDQADRGLPWASRVIHASRVRARLRNHSPIVDSAEELLRTYEASAGKCQVCEFETASLHCDHDHETGRIRGWLCSNCNTALGLAGDSQVVLLRMAEYLKQHEADASN
jgi:ribosomal protein L37E